MLFEPTYVPWLNMAQPPGTSSVVGSCLPCLGPASKRSSPCSQRFICKQQISSLKCWFCYITQSAVKLKYSTFRVLKVEYLKKLALQWPAGQLRTMEHNACGHQASHLHPICQQFKASVMRGRYKKYNGSAKNQYDRGYNRCQDKSRFSFIHHQVKQVNNYAKMALSSILR